MSSKGARLLILLGAMTASACTSGDENWIISKQDGRPSGGVSAVAILRTADGEPTLEFSCLNGSPVTLGIFTRTELTDAEEVRAKLRYHFENSELDAYTTTFILDGRNLAFLDEGGTKRFDIPILSGLRSATKLLVDLALPSGERWSHTFDVKGARAAIDEVAVGCR